MATVAAHGKASHSRRKSRRISAACAFLSNISLDGNIIQSKVKPNLENETQRLDEDSQKSRAAVVSERSESSQDTIKSRRHKVFHSVSVTGESQYSEEKRINYVYKEKSSKNTTPVHFPIRRSVSLSESTSSEISSSGSQSARWQTGSLKHKVLYLNSPAFLSKRRDNDKRIVLSTAHRVPCVTYSILKYHKKSKEHGQDVASHGARRSTVSHIDPQSFCIDGVEVSTGGKAVSYSSFLVPNYAWNERTASTAKPHPSGQLTVDVSSATGSSGEVIAAIPMATDRYDAFLLDDPELTSGRHRTVLKLSSFVVSTIAYAKPSELKKDLNEQFHEKFPNINITLTKLRSIKRDLVRIATAQDCQLDLSTAAYAFVYFEKLVLKEKINRLNRKLVAGSCLLLAAKLNDDFKRERIKKVIEEIEDRFRVNVKQLIKLEFQVLVALDFNLHIPRWEVMPHLKRLQSEQL